MLFSPQLSAKPVLGFALLALISLPATAQLVPEKSPDQTPAQYATSVTSQSDLGWIITIRNASPFTPQTMRELSSLRAEYSTQRVRGRAIQELAGYENRFRAEADRAQQNLHNAAEGFLAVLKSGGGRVAADLWLTGSFHVLDVDETLLEILRAHPDVAQVSANRWHSPQLLQATDVNHHNAVGVHAMSVGGVNITGKGIGIAVIDSGLDIDMNGTGKPHATFYVNGDSTDLSGGGIAGSRIKTSWGATGTLMPYQVTNLDDIDGHGTRIGSMIGGTKFAKHPIIANGMAPGADLHNLKISNDTLPGAPAWTVAMALAMQEAFLTPGVRVANMSYDGEGLFAHEYVNRAIDSLCNAGVLVTLSAGNHGTDLSYAHNARNALISGGSFEFSPWPYPTSAIGPLGNGHRYPDLIAQGTDITSAMLDNELGWFTSAGTSGASALTAGAAALVFQADPSLTPPEVKALLLNTTWDLQGGDPMAGGLGYMRAKEAVDDALLGMVQNFAVEAGHAVTHKRTLSAGEVASFTLVWERSGLLNGTLSTVETIGELDLSVIDPNGAIIFASQDTINNEERFRFTAASSGEYKIIVTGVTNGGGQNFTAFSLAGVDTPGVDENGCAGSGLGITTPMPLLFQAVQQDSSLPLVTVAGCNVSFVTGAAINGKSLAVTHVSPTKIQVTVDTTGLFGPQSLTLLSALGPEILPIEITAVSPPVLTADSHGLTTTGFSFDAYASEGDFVAMLFSPDLVPSVVPGFYNLAIGAGSTSLTMIACKQIPAGDHHVQIAIPPMATQVPAFFLYSQFVVIPASGVVLPLPTSNYGKTNITF